MRVCVRALPDSLSRSIHRVGNALTKYAPSWAQVVQNIPEADFVVHHLIGLSGVSEVLKKDAAAGRRYAVVQYCLRTTENPTPEAWGPIWSDAVLVSSYYDLKQWWPGVFNFIHQPLGVDGDVFKMNGKAEFFLMGTSGYVAETEGVREAYTACIRNGGTLFHLGPNLRLGSKAHYALGITDTEVAKSWARCKYVAGLRRVEGFELPALEALAVGTRPVCFDAPHYRQWFGEHAEYVPEGSFAEVTQQLTELLARPVRPVTPVEREHIVDRFSWKRFATEFWNAAEGVLR